jgi:exosome complex protein LRP1
MDVSDITPQLDQLEEELRKAEDSLEPLLGDIGDISSKLPLLDKAKLYVLVAYAIEALLFCETCPPALLSAFTHTWPATLRLNGVDTKNHAIFTELTRVRQYTEKIQKLEAPPAERENTVNTEAAARILRSDLVSFPVLLVHKTGSHTTAGRQQRHQGKINGAYCQRAGEGGAEGR